jgi:hypothetical protein
MARYALRNQQKISSVLGADFLARLLQSADYHFANCEIKEIRKHPDTEPYDRIEIYDGKNDTTYVFYIISKKYDIYMLAFKEEIKQ